MKMKRIVYLLCVLQIIVQLVCAQIPPAGSNDNFKEVVLKMREEYKNLEKLHVAMSIQVFENSSATKAYFSQVADVKRNKSNYLYKFAGHEWLMNDKYMLMIDHSSKEIFCNTRNPQSELSVFKNSFQWNIDSLLQFYGETVYVGSEGQTDRYRIVQKSGQVEMIDLYIDSSASLLKGIGYTYRDKQYVKIDFKIFDRHPDFAPTLFSENNYIRMQNGKIMASGKFRNFSVRNVNDSQ